MIYARKIRDLLMGTFLMRDTLWWSEWHTKNMLLTFLSGKCTELTNYKHSIFIYVWLQKELPQTKYVLCQKRIYKGELPRLKSWRHSENIVQLFHAMGVEWVAGSGYIYNILLDHRYFARHIANPQTHIRPGIDHDSFAMWSVLKLTWKTVWKMLCNFFFVS